MTTVLLYFQNFNYSILISTLIQILTFKKFAKKNFEQRLCLSLVLILIFYPFAINSFGFQMSSLARVGILLTIKFNIKNKVLFSFCLTIIINLLLWPIIGNINSQISLWTIILSYIYSWLFIANFILVFCLFPIYWIGDLFSFIFEIQKIIFDFFTTINVTFKITGLEFVGIYLYEIFTIGLINFIIDCKKKKRIQYYTHFSNRIFNSIY